jgi:hypothetical protein
MGWRREEDVGQRLQKFLLDRKKDFFRSVVCHPGYNSQQYIAWLKS